MHDQLYAPFQTKFVELPDGEKLAYIEEGKGSTTVLFIHGLANYALGWKRNIEELRKYYRCISLDLPGNGLSSIGDKAYTIAYFSDVVAAFIDVLELKRTVLVGHSMGGQIAIMTVLRHPALISRLVLCAPAGFEVFAGWEAALYEASLTMFDLFSSDESSLVKAIYASFYHQPQQAKGMIDDLLRLQKRYPVSAYRAMVKSCIHSMLHTPVFDQLPLIRIPALVIFGEQDALIPARALHPVSTRKIAEAACAKIPDCRLEIIPHAGHFVQWEKASRVNSLIQAFIG